MRRILVAVIISVVAIAGALLMLNFFGNTDFQINGLEAELKIDLQKPGMTEIQVPPLGKITAKTHKSPAGIKIILKSIDLNQLKGMVEEAPKAGELAGKVEADIKSKFKALIYKVILLGIIGGTGSIWLLQRRHWYEYLYGAILGIVTVSLLLTLTYKSYNTDSFQSPEYEGMLKTAPWMIGLVQEGIAKFDLWGQQLQSVADNLYDMFQRVDSLEAMGPEGNGDLRVLHVSDLHNNPAAFDFIEQVAETFQADFIVDTGDISDFGTPLETVFLERLKAIKVPYVFVPGNHETEDIIRELRNTPNVKVVEEGPVKVKGVNIIGISDPAAYGREIKSGEEAFIETENKLSRIIAEGSQEPDILAVHNHRLAGKFVGVAPVILHGHDHAYKIRNAKGSVIIDAGTTGAAGVGGLEANKDIPYSLVVLQFKRQEKGYKLIAADTIKVSNMQSGYSLERKMFPELYQVEEKQQSYTLTE